MAKISATATEMTFLSPNEVLQTNFTKGDSSVYNRLSSDSAQPTVSEEHLTNLSKLFVRYNAHGLLGIHLIHNHFQIPVGTVMLGKTYKDPMLRWTTVTDVKDLKAEEVHGHIFALTNDGFCAYEYQEGPLPDLSCIKAGFFEELTSYLRSNGLENVLGLQVLCDQWKKPMGELVLRNGTAMIETSSLQNVSYSRTTGWRFQAPGQAEAIEDHMPPSFPFDDHFVFPEFDQPVMDTVDDLKQALRGAGLLQA